tara:strand:+ start:2380 stop:3420 length:1041 start_codon:yes stop_codon:yes gene_type:complete
MAVNKNFVVKNGLEVNNDLILANATNSRVGIGTSVPQYTLHTQGGIGATTLHVAGVSTFLSDVRITGVTTLASAGGITTTGGDFYVGGDLYVLDDVVYDEVTGRNLSITGVGTINRLDISKDINVTGVSTFVGVSTFTNVWVGGGMTIAGNLDVTGDISYDEVSGRNLKITGVGTITRLNTTNINNTGVSTITRLNTTDVVSTAGTITTGTITQLTNTDQVSTSSTITSIVGTSATITRLNVTDLVGTISTITRLNWTDAVGTSATITTLSGTTATFDTINAGTVSGTGQVGVASEGTFLGAGASMLNFASTNGTSIAVDPAETSGIATITITTGVSLGLAIALGG